MSRHHARPRPQPARRAPFRDWLRARLTPRALHTGFARLVSLVGLVAGLAVVGWFAGQLVTYRWQRIQEVDTQGYFEIAKSFARAEWPRWPDEYSRFRDHVWVDPALPGDGPRTNSISVPPFSPDSPPLVTAKYPPGWPLLLAAGYTLGGAHGALWVNPLLAIAGVLFFFLLARELGGNVAAAICTFIWATSPMLLMYVDYPLAHGPEITVTLLAFLCAALWARRPRAGWAFASGLCAGFLPLLRPTTVLVWPALAVFYVTLRREAAQSEGEPRTPAGAWREWAANLRRAARSLRPLRWLRTAEGQRWLAAACGALIPLGFLAAYNLTLFGHVTRTGYYFTAEQQAFDLTWLHPRLNEWIGSTWQGDPAGHWLRGRWSSIWQLRSYVLENGLLILCLLGLLLRARRPGLAAAFVLWFTPPLLLYVSYYFYHGGPVFYRFILGGVPALALGVALAFGPGLRRAPLLQLLLLAGFALWMAQAPPRYFSRRDQVTRGEHRDRQKFPLYSYQLSDPLTGGFAQRERHNPTTDLEPLIAHRATAAYAPADLQWQVALYPRVTAYDSGAWTDERLFRPFRGGRQFLPQVWGHTARAQRIHASLSPLGAEGLRKLFERQVQRHLDADTQVLIFVEEEEPAVLAWARENPAWRVEPAYTRPPPAVGDPEPLPPLAVWRIRPAEPAPSP